MIENIKNKFLPFLKKYWWIILISLIVLIALAFVVIQITGKHNDNKNDFGSDNIYFSEDLPVCPADLSGLFTKEIIPLSQVDFITPLGMVNASSHTIPTDHIYMNQAKSNQRIAVYAPTDATITGGENKETYSSATDTIIRNDFSLDLLPCRGLLLNFTHFSELSPALTEEYQKVKTACPTNGKYHFGDDMTTYYTPCGYRMNIKVKAGDLLGYTIALPTNRYSGIDIGLYNLNSDPLEYISPERYSDENLHAICPLSPYTPELKAGYMKKLGDWGKETNIFIPRTIEPLCGQDMYDILGTLKGNWYAGNKGVGSESTEYMMALVPDFIDPSKYQISLKGPDTLGTYVNMLFSPTHSGKINRDFGEVTADGNIYCYPTQAKQDEVMKDGSIKKGDDGLPKYLIQLVDDTHLKIERKIGSCTENKTFENPYIYER